MAISRPDNRSSETLKLIQSLWDPYFTFDEEIWWDNEVFDIAKKKIVDSDIIINRAEKVIEKHNSGNYDRSIIAAEKLIEKHKKSKAAFQALINEIIWK